MKSLRHYNINDKWKNRTLKWKTESEILQVWLNDNGTYDILDADDGVVFDSGISNESLARSKAIKFEDGHNDHRNYALRSSGNGAKLVNKKNGVESREFSDGEIGKYMQSFDQKVDEITQKIGEP
jgi:hypothetical protein